MFADKIKKAKQTLVTNYYIQPYTYVITHMHTQLPHTG